MSWDIFVQDLPRDAATVVDIPPHFEPSPIGKRADIIAKIKEIVPAADFSDPSWGVIEGESWSIEVNIGKSEICKGFALHVRGGDEAVAVVAAILDHLDLRALDGQTGEFFTPGPEALDSFRRWRAFRDRVIGNGDS
jgi:hypothetical protein